VRKLPATIRCVGFVNDINHLDLRCGTQVAPLGMAETGGNSLQELPARTFLAVLPSPPKGALQEPIGVSLAEIAETVT
jgi:hypothetical protein